MLFIVCQLSIIVLSSVHLTWAVSISTGFPERGVILIGHTEGQFRWLFITNKEHSKSKVTVREGQPKRMVCKFTFDMLHVK